MYMRDLNDGVSTEATTTPRMLLRLPDDILDIIHDWYGHPDETTGHCHCALGRTNRHLRSLFQYTHVYTTIRAFNIPRVVASHARVRQLEVFIHGYTTDAEWSTLRYVQDAPRLRSLTVRVDEVYLLKAFHLHRLADLLRTLPRCGVPRKMLCVCVWNARRPNCSTSPSSGASRCNRRHAPHCGPCCLLSSHPCPPFGDCVCTRLVVLNRSLICTSAMPQWKPANHWRRTRMSRTSFHPPPPTHHQHTCGRSTSTRGFCPVRPKGKKKDPAFCLPPSFHVWTDAFYRDTTDATVVFRGGRWIAPTSESIVAQTTATTLVWENATFDESDLALCRRVIHEDGPLTATMRSLCLNVANHTIIPRAFLSKTKTTAPADRRPPCVAAADAARWRVERACGWILGVQW